MGTSWAWTLGLIGCLLGSGPTLAENHFFGDTEGIHIKEAPADAIGGATNTQRSGSPAFSQEGTSRARTTGEIKYKQLIEAAAREHAIEAALLRAVIAAESGYNPRAISQKGAVGLMQLMPGIAQRYGVVNRFDPAENVRAGAKYLRDLLNKFNNDVSLAVAAYNAGEIVVERHGNRIPPYGETRSYVTKVMNLYRRYRSAPG